MQNDLDPRYTTLVLGIGNLLWADEGFGVRCVEELHRCWQFPPSVCVMDGGTQGLYLVQYVQQAENLLVFDAIDWGLAPGTLKIVRGDEVPAFMGCRKMSLHQTGFQEVIAAASLLGQSPSRMTLIGIQAEELDDWGGGLRPSIRARVAEVLSLGLDELASWGISGERRAEPLSGRDGLIGHSLDWASYETAPETAPETASATASERATPCA